MGHLNKISFARYPKEPTFNLALYLLQISKNAKMIHVKTMGLVEMSPMCIATAPKDGQAPFVKKVCAQPFVRNKAFINQ